MAKTLLVTGGAGFIGSNFVLRAVRDLGHRVVNLDKLTYAGNLENLASLEGDARHLHVRGDICDRALVNRLLDEHEPDALVNFAAESHVDRSIDAPAQFLQTNVVGTFELLEASRRYFALSKSSKAARSTFRFLHVSTDEVFGSLGAEGAFRESTPYAPSSPYAATKASADHLVRAYHHTYGLPSLTTNCSNNYGPHQFPEKLIPLMILNALEGKPLPVYGDGKNVRDWLFVEDHVDALLLVLERGAPGETYNIGGKNELENLTLVEQLCALLDELAPPAENRALLAVGRELKSYRELVTFVADRPGHDRRYAIDPTKVETLLGFTPKHDFAQGIRETVRWYLSHRDWCEHITSGSYRRERLGLGSASAS
jgi:dTDP-glucose 4,6-dehydratase